MMGHFFNTIIHVCVLFSLCNMQPASSFLNLLFIVAGIGKYNMNEME